MSFFHRCKESHHGTSRPDYAQTLGPSRPCMGHKDRISLSWIKTKAKLGYLHLGNLESNASEESKYQQWAEENLWAFGNYYVNIDSDRNLSKRKVVDLPVQNIRGYIDIIELKTPTANGFETDSKENIKTTYGALLMRLVRQLLNALNIYPDTIMPVVIIHGQLLLSVVQKRARMACGNSFAECAHAQHICHDIRRFACSG